MQITSQQHYAATPDQVFAMFTDESYLQACCERFGSTDSSVSVTETGSVVNMALPSPPQVQKIVGNSLRLNQDIQWSAPAGDGSRTGVVAMKVEKMPADVGGTATLRPNGAGTDVEYTVDLNVKIPLLGKKLEEQAAPVVLKALKVQEQVGHTYLASNS
ncbi:DUF2505 domain-containing protein [Propionibacteriaceae bacterium G1746]|uniref:DUF2505 domain-containing protein n=1 Tax=Aestuariimicrobium sp. G57 TaxID=3418485 RepID=UPI003C197AC8